MNIEELKSDFESISIFLGNGARWTRYRGRPRVLSFLFDGKHDGGGYHCQNYEY